MLSNKGGTYKNISEYNTDVLTVLYKHFLGGNNLTKLFFCMWMIIKKKSREVQGK